MHCCTLNRVVGKLAALFSYRPRVRRIRPAWPRTMVEVEVIQMGEQCRLHSPDTED